MLVRQPSSCEGLGGKEYLLRIWWMHFICSGHFIMMASFCVLPIFSPRVRLFFSSGWWQITASFLLHIDLQAMQWFEILSGTDSIEKLLTHIYDRFMRKEIC
jgi:hypothetical protein